jgi:glycosyltransferase involved in cell wall biosynthesis
VALRGPDLDLEVIVADNGSSCDIESLAGSFDARFTQTAIVGPSASRNAGVAIATGEYIAFLDDDDLWTADHLRPHLAFLARHPEFDAVVSQVIRTDMECHPTSEPYPISLPADGKIFGNLLQQWLQIGALVARTSTIRDLGGFDEALPAGEDWDLMLRLAVAVKVGFVPVPTVLFRARPSGLVSEDRINAFRAGINARVFRRNVMRAGSQRPPLLTVLNAYKRYLGLYASYLMGNCQVHLQNGNKKNARRALLWAFRVSPLHVMGYFALRPYWRRTMLHTVV